MKKVKVKFFKTVHGRDRMCGIIEYETIEEAMQAVKEWEDETPTHYAVYQQR